MMLCCLLFFFFKQKTAYEMRISDWSSDVCSSDLGGGAVGRECFAILGKAAGLAVLPTPRFPEPATPSGCRASAASGCHRGATADCPTGRWRDRKSVV